MSQKINCDIKNGLYGISRFWKTIKIKVLTICIYNDVSWPVSWDYLFLKSFEEPLWKCDALNGWEFHWNFPLVTEISGRSDRPYIVLANICCTPEMWYSPFSFLWTTQGVTITNYDYLITCACIRVCQT